MDREHERGSRPQRPDVGHVEHVQPVCQRPEGQLDAEAEVRAAGNEPRKGDALPSLCPRLAGVVSKEIEVCSELQKPPDQAEDPRFVACLPAAHHMAVEACPEVVLSGQLLAP